MANYVTPGPTCGSRAEPIDHGTLNRQRTPTVGPVGSQPGANCSGARVTRYTKSLDTSGWLKVRLEPSGQMVYLCEFLKVEITGFGERTHFTVMEGEHRGRVASLKSENATKCLVNPIRGTGAKLVVKVGQREELRSPVRKEKHNQLVSTLYFNGQSSMITLDSDVDYIEKNPLSPNYNKLVHSRPLPKRKYRIMEPDTPKKAGNTDWYRTTQPGGYADLKYDTVWFPIEYAATQNSNYVHVGHLSEGCVTIYDLTKWNLLYQYLISNRMDQQGKYVGTISIE